MIGICGTAVENGAEYVTGNVPKQSPISALTGVDVEQLRYRYAKPPHCRGWIKVESKRFS